MEPDRVFKTFGLTGSLIIEHNARKKNIVYTSDFNLFCP